MSETKLRAVFLDWAGTTVDHGSVAPIRAIANVFAKNGISLELSVVRRFMGLSKQEHVRQLLLSAEAKEQWIAKYQREPNEADAVNLYSELGPEFMQVVKTHSAVIPGVVKTIDCLRQKGMKIGGTTGYTRQMYEAVAAASKPQGYWTDLTYTSEDVPAGRPYPWMCYRLALDLQIYPLWNVVKIGDTQADVQEGVNAGMWTIGLTRCGNLVGLTESEWEQCPEDERTKLLANAESALRGAGAHYIAESVADCLPILEEIEARLKRGERP